MKKQYIFVAIILFGFILSNAQTIEDVKKLELTDSQLRTSFEKRQILLVNNSTGKKKKIKEGAFAIIKMKGDTAKMELILEAFLSDTIIVSSLIPQLIGKEIKLGFTEFRLLPIKDIESIEYSVRHIKGTYWVSFLMTLTGLEMAVLPVIMPLIIGNSDKVYSRPQFPFIVVGGVVLYICGKILQKALNPKEYKIGTDWDYRVVKK
jgi:hypothetical protein